MLEKIRSVYVLRMPFSLLHSHKFYKLIKYNKSLQEKLEINIINFMEYSGKYIIYETKEKGKEYDIYNNKLIYQGEFLDGERNGEGKEYYYNKPGKHEKINYYEEYIKNKKRVKFVGEYLKGKIWNGKVYDRKGDIICVIKNGDGYIEEYYKYNFIKFVCKFHKGEFNGKGKSYSFFGQLNFEGDYLNGNKWNGKGYELEGKKRYELKEGKGFLKEYYSDGTIKFEGYYLNGERNGKGKEYHKNGKIKYDGEFIDGKRNGYGIKYNTQGEVIFEGEYLYGHKKKGKYYLNGILEYEGEYRFDKKWNGKGFDENGNIIYELINGNGKVKEYKKGILIFSGEYLDGKKNGKGYELEESYLKYCGEYINNVKNGKGREYYSYSIKSLNEIFLIGEANNDWTFGLKFDGEFLNGEKRKGKLYNPNGILEFEGEFSNGKKYKGKEYNSSGLVVFEGQYLNGEMWSGKRKEYYCCNNEIKFEGEIFEGIRWNGKGKEYDGGKIVFDGEYINGERVGNKCLKESI